MRLLLMISISFFSASFSTHAQSEENIDTSQEMLTILSVAYALPEAASSCGLLRQRDLERQKVIRELDGSDVLQLNNLLTNKYFLDPAVWQDETVAVLVTAAISDGLVEQIRKYGISGTFVELNGPGVVWHSYLSQMLDGLSYTFDLEKGLVKVRYSVYQNIFCGGRLENPILIWHKN